MVITGSDTKHGHLSNQDTEDKAWDEAGGREPPMNDMGHRQAEE